MELTPQVRPRRPKGVTASFGSLGLDFGDPLWTTRVDAAPVTFATHGGELAVYVLNDTGAAVAALLPPQRSCNTGAAHSEYIVIPVGFEGFLAHGLPSRTTDPAAGEGSIVFVDGGGGFPLVTLVRFT